MAASTDNPSTNLFVPALGSLYAALNTTSETILRAVAGIFLTIHGSGKITDPLGTAEMVEGLGFYPGAGRCCWPAPSSSAASSSPSVS
ncbi:hypothetical protein BQ8794_140450 [Mesorhizobium prunaredense]|uniref:DoxX family protein n=1 Tax=Mesorhizobium prunaredense TaxID=1631249 RepID=A0A1R3V7H0_9HYPH|nr:hypothetical protein BQ8794_140450 [Mesorhizobium prunaredense]